MIIAPIELTTLDVQRLVKPCRAVIGVAIQTPNHGFDSQIIIVARNEEQLKLALDWFKQRGKFNRLDMQKVAIIPFEAIEDPDEL